MYRNRCWNSRRTSALSRTRLRARISRSRKSSAPAFCLRCSKPVDALVQVLVHQRRQIGVGAIAELDDGRDQRIARVEQRLTRDVPAVLRAAALALQQVARLGGQRAEPRLPSVVVVMPARAELLDVRRRAPDVLGVPEQQIATADRVRAEVGERLQVADQLVDLALAREAGRPRPAGGMIAPLQQLEARAAEPLQRAVVLLVR